MKISHSIFILFGCLSLLAIPFGGSDLSRRIIWSLILLPGGLVALGYGLEKITFSSRDLVGIPLFAAVGFFLSLLINYQFAGGDFYHAYRGFPYRWLIGSTPLDQTRTLLDFYFPGILADGLFWLNASLLLVLALHFVMPKHKNTTPL